MATLYQELHRSKTHKVGNDPACPICQRHKAVSEILDTVSAHHLCDTIGPDGGALAFYSLPNGATIILQWFKNDHGFEMYRPLSLSNRIEDAFMALSQLAAEQSE